MNVNADTDGLLKALLKLEEADRGHIVEHLSPDKVKNAFLLLLREKDGVSVLQKQPLAHAPLAIHPVSAHEPATISNKRGNSAATSNDLKREKTDAVVAQNVEKGAAQIVVKKEHETIEIASDAEEPEAETIDQLKSETVAQPADLPMYFIIRNEPGHDTLNDFEDLPVIVQAELKRRFEEMWSLHEIRTRNYTKCTRNPAKYMDGPRCIRSLVIHGWRSTGAMYSQGREFRNTANDDCINAGRPCAYFTKYNNEYIIRLVSLPRALRLGKDWTEIGYWVQ